MFGWGGRHQWCLYARAGRLLPALSVAAVVAGAKLPRRQQHIATPTSTPPLATALHHSSPATAELLARVQLAHYLDEPLAVRRAQ
jgi:hypothetical protein